MLPAVGLLLAGFVGLTYGQAFGLPFLNDDYLFLEKVGQLSLFDLWKPEQLFFGWYRPWSRELHYWVLLHVVGLEEPAYHAVSIVLWLAIMILYFALVRRLAGGVSAAIATAGLATLALWSAPLLWIAGVQDLWMLFFALLFLHALARGWTRRAIPALILALLSKETAAVLPGVAMAYVWLIERLTLRQAIRRTLGLWAVLVSWLLLHPTLSLRFFGPLQYSDEADQRPSMGLTLLKTALAQFNLEARLAPETGWGSVLARGALAGGVLALIILATRRWPETQLEAGAVRPRRRRALAFAALWALMGWSILVLPSIGWHAYYGVLGSLGFWLGVGTALSAYPRSAAALVVCLALLREAHVAMPSWDWGSSWYQKRAGSFLGAIRYKLRDMHPVLPRHSRLYFARLPNDMGFLGGNAPAIRIWYEDPTLEAGFYSWYVTRSSADSIGEDYFFRFDTLAVLVEVQSGKGSRDRPAGGGASWQHDHAVLASLLMRGGNIVGAAETHEKLWRALPHRPDHAVYAAGAFLAAGDTTRARPLELAARRALGDSLVQASMESLVGAARSFRTSALERARPAPKTR